MKRIVAKAQWKTVNIKKDDYEDDGNINFDDLIELQELTDYDIEEGPACIKAKKRKAKESHEESAKKPKLDLEEREDSKVSEKPKKKKAKSKKKKSKPSSSLISQTSSDDHGEPVTNPVDGMSNWNDLFVPPEILRCLNEKHFMTPTAIQSLVLPSAIRDRMDIIGAAETGSGKTLAFAIPIVAHLLRMKQEDEENDMEVDGDDKSEDEGSDDENGTSKSVKQKPLRSLIMTPTRELALQIRDHIKDITKYTDIKCAAIVGGMSVEKQTRLLKYAPEIIVATPGRLWELIQQRERHVCKLKGLKFLIIDEADRMMERNHFEELEQILNYINLKGRTQNKQNFLFSATLTFVHKKPHRMSFKKKKMKDITLEDKIDSLRKKLRMSKKPKVVDLTKGQNMVSQKLVEKKIDCQIEDKDMYLYYFVKSHPGRTLIFANSKDCVRRLTSLLRVLKCKPLPLHGDNPQKQRLKSIDRFRDDDDGLLLATDVAARGLDIPNVQHVVHYQVPRTAENYVHRSGRTARSNKDGLSVVLIAPVENAAFKSILISMNRDKDLPKLEVDQASLHSISHSVNLARNIEKAEHRLKKDKVQKDWLSKACEEADMIMDEDLIRDDDDGEDILEESVQRNKLDALKLELGQLLGCELRTNPKKKCNKKNKKQHTG